MQRRGSEHDNGFPLGKKAEELVSNHFYRQGLLCASHPRAALFFTFVIIFGACYPLLSIPIYSSKAQTFVEKVDRTSTENFEQEEMPRWRVSQKPQAYIQQIILKSTIHPFKKDDLIRTDAFRAPLASAFKLHMDEIANFRDLESLLDMDHECVRTDGISSRYKNTAAASILPEYGCLIVSPANLWMRDPVTFQLDPNVVSTVFNFQNSHPGHSSLTDLMFGMRQRETGMTKYPVRNRQRVITFAVTIALKDNNQEFISKLRKHLHKNYPLNVFNLSYSNEMVNIFFPPHHFYLEFLTFAITLLVLFLYVYFSCSKIEFVRSKLGIALSAVFTVLGAVTMSLGLSGVSLNIHSKVYAVPYLVAFISLENILVVTKSVMSTPAHLDSKIRVAQGLSLEGWNILKNLLAQITVLTFGFFLGILDHSIQQFCLVAVMGLLSDFFLQTFFFTTILSMDIRQLELSDVLQKQPSPQKEGRLFQHPVSGPGHTKNLSSTQKSVVAPQCNTPVPKKEAKRVRLMNYWAKIRIIQRLFLLAMAVWLSTFIYQTSLFEVILKAHQDSVLVDPVEMSANDSKEIPRDSSTPVLLAALNVTSSDDQLSGYGESISKPVGLKRLLHSPTLSPWKNLPHTHWPMLFGLYNISLSGQYISLLPPILLSLSISPETAKRLRHPQESEGISPEKSDTSTEDETDDEEISDVESDESLSAELSPFAPSSPGELFLAFVFVFPSLIFILYLMVLFYRCLCSRNYAEWRSTCFVDKDNQNKTYGHVIHESLPIPLEGHLHEIECLHSAENLVVSLCLGGKIYTWDSQSGQKYSEMDRKQHFVPESHGIPSNCHSFSSFDDSFNSLGQSPTSAAPINVPRISTVDSTENFSAYINTNFSSMAKNHLTNGIDKPFNFSKFVQQNKNSSNHVSLSGGAVPSVWALDSYDRFVVLGCSNGRIEVWEVETGNFQCSYDDEKGVGITHLRVSTSSESHSLRLVVARLSGQLEFMSLMSSDDPDQYLRQKFQRSISDPIGPSRRTHVRNLSNGLENNWHLSMIVDIQLLQIVKAHSQPVLCMDIRGGKVLTGSQDHTLRVLRLDDYIAVYTLHGHCSPVTSAFIDALEPSTSGSGSQNGMLCVWALYTGACVYSIQAHDGAVLSMTYSPNYVVSMGSDNKLCVWERVQGHLINSISLRGGPYCHDLIMLTHNLLVTARKGYLVVWDVRLPDPVRLIKLGDSDVTQPVSMMTQLGDTIACSYGNQMRLVHFPMLTDKED